MYFNCCLVKQINCKCTIIFARLSGHILGISCSHVLQHVFLVPLFGILRAIPKSSALNTSEFSRVRRASKTFDIFNSQFTELKINFLFSSPVRKYRKSYCSHPDVGVGVSVSVVVAQMFKSLWLKFL